VTPEAQSILSHLQAVASERARRATDAEFAARVAAVKQFQHARFAASYSDLLTHARFGRAARFFLDDLYGPQDFTERDAQFARIVPALVRLFPADIVHTVSDLAELHALSEQLDSALAIALGNVPVQAESYGKAWRSVGRAGDRERQIVLMLQVGTALDGFTRKPLLRHSLRLMRGPATAAGLGAMQKFLETGFDTFREMQGAQRFLDTIAQRERALAAALFADAAPGTPGTPGTPATPGRASSTA
jgi:hypothetical protein